MSKTLSKAAFTALRWNYMGFVARSGSNFLIGVFLARLLGPKPFGQLAAAALVITIANLLADAGFTSALVQSPEITQVEIRYVFTMQLLIAAALSAFCVGTAGSVARTFHDPAIRQVLIGLSPIFLVQAIGQTASALLRRKMDFRAIQTAQVSSYLAGYICIGIPMALLGAGVWSLVASQLSQTFIFSIQLYLRVRHSIVPTLDPSGLRLLRFGSKVMLANIANWGISNLDNAVVGHTFGSTSLGLYSRSFTLANAPCDGIVGTVQQVLFTSCSRAEGRIEPIRKAYMASLSAIALFVFPSFWAMAACAPTVMVGLYGEGWRSAAVLFRPLALAISVQAVMAVAGPILASVDRVRQEINAQLLTLVVAVACFLITSRYSPTVLSWGVCGVYLFRFVAMTRPTIRILGLRWKDLIRLLGGPIVAGLVTALILSLIDKSLLRAGGRPLPILLLLCVSGAIVLPLLIVCFGRFLLTPALVGFLKTGLSGMPRPVVNLLERISQGQEPEGKVVPIAASSDQLSVPIYIATTIQKAGETGVQTHFNTLFSYLQDFGNSGKILTPYEAPAALRRIIGVGMRLLLLVDVELAWYFKDFFYAKLLWLRMRAVIPTDKPWIVYAQCPVSSLVAERFRKRDDQRVVLVTHFHQSHAEEMVEGGLIRHDGRVYRNIQAGERAALLGADRIVYVSDFMRTHLVSTFEGLDRRPSVVLPNFVFKPASEPGGYSGDLVSIGTLESRKNQSFLLEVLAAAKRKGTRYTLTLFGTGNREREWQQLAVELGVADQVTFAGYVPNASRYLHSFRVYVHAARVENMPVSLIEAMACGLPIIAARVGGTPEIIVEGHNGFFWNLEDPEGSADLVMKLLGDEDLLASMRSAALEGFADKFSAEHVAPRLADFIMNGNPMQMGVKLDVLGGPGFMPITDPIDAKQGA